MKKKPLDHHYLLLQQFQDSFVILSFFPFNKKNLIIHSIDNIVVILFILRRQQQQQQQ